MKFRVGIEGKITITGVEACSGEAASSQILKCIKDGLLVVSGEDLLKVALTPTQAGLCPVPIITVKKLERIWFEPES